MRAFRLIYYYIALSAVVLLVTTACYNDEAVATVDSPQKEGPINVRLRVSQAGSIATRGTEDWEDKDNALDKEMMNVWTVVATVAGDDDAETAEKVVYIWACKPDGKPDQEVDDIVTNFSNAGTYRFYSFANMSPKYVVKELLDIDIADTDAIATYMEPANKKNEVTAFTVPADAAVKYGDVKRKAVKVAGNGFKEFTSKDDNGFGAYGIPMSNVQKLTLSNGDEKDLIVVRMLAKVKLQIYNDSGKEMTIESIKLTNLTANPDDNAGNANLMLLPELSDAGHNDMKVIKHGDIQPNLNGTPKQVYLELPFTPDNNNGSGTIDAENHKSDANADPVEFTFYVNESDVRKKVSEAPTDPINPINPNPIDFYHFFLEIKLKDEPAARYVLIDDKGTQENESWAYIARNDYRIIPIVLDDYKLDIIPYDFPAIGVHPASVKEEDGIYTVNFHDYGHFHLQPIVTKYSDTNNPKKVVPYGQSSDTDADKTYWTLVKDNAEKEDFNLSWGSWTDASKQTPYDNATGKFYRDKTDSADGDDAGGVPVWYANTPSNPLDPSSPPLPQWAPNTTVGYQPFIFGYIADPESTVTTDKKVYHEFTINLYKSGTGAARQMTYRLYMILDTQQMLYSRSLGAPATRHTHGH